MIDSWATVKRAPQHGEHMFEVSASDKYGRLHTHILEVDTLVDLSDAASAALGKHVRTNWELDEEEFANVRGLASRLRKKFESALAGIEVMFDKHGADGPYQLTISWRDGRHLVAGHGMSYDQVRKYIEGMHTALDRGGSDANA